MDIPDRRDRRAGRHRHRCDLRAACARAGAFCHARGLHRAGRVRTYGALTRAALQQPQKFPTTCRLLVPLGAACFVADAAAARAASRTPQARATDALHARRQISAVSGCDVRLRARTGDLALEGPMQALAQNPRVIETYPALRRRRSATSLFHVKHRLFHVRAVHIQIGLERAETRTRYNSRIPFFRETLTRHLCPA